MSRNTKQLGQLGIGRTPGLSRRAARNADASASYLVLAKHVPDPHVDRIPVDLTLAPLCADGLLARIAALEATVNALRVSLIASRQMEAGP